MADEALLNSTLSMLYLTLSEYVYANTCITTRIVTKDPVFCLLAGYLMAHSDKVCLSMTVLAVMQKGRRSSSTSGGSSHFQAPPSWHKSGPTKYLDPHNVLAYTECLWRWINAAWYSHGQHIRLCNSRLHSLLLPFAAARGC